jgi:hypothetical protein
LPLIFSYKSEKSLYGTGWEEQQQAASACMAYSDATENAVTGAGNAQYGCWIGFQVGSSLFASAILSSV